MLGTEGKHTVQLSKQGDSLIDRAAVYTIKQRGLELNTGRFISIVRNDERVSNGVNLNIPTVSLTRWPYKEYHTSDDNPSIINMKKLRDSSDITRDVIETLDENTTLTPGDFYGEPFLTRFGLFHDFKEGPSGENLYAITEDIFSYSDGKTSLFEIANKFNHPWKTVRKMADGLVKNGLFTETYNGKSDEKMEVGVDCVDIKEFGKGHMTDKAFMDRHFSQKEIKNVHNKNDRSEYLASCYAAKMAIIKALANQGSELRFTDIEITEDNNIKTAKICDNENLDVKLSLSQHKDMVIAAALVLRKGPNVKK